MATKAHQLPHEVPEGTDASLMRVSVTNASVCATYDSCSAILWQLTCQN